MLSNLIKGFIIITIDAALRLIVIEVLVCTNDGLQVASLVPDAAAVYPRSVYVTLLNTTNLRYQAAT